MKPLLDLLKDIKDNGHDHPDRTLVGRRSIFGTQTRFKMSDGFPLATTRQVYTRSLVEELLFFIRGSTDIRELQAAGVNMWNKWGVTEENIEAFAVKHSDGDDKLKDIILDQFKNTMLGSIGRMYGAIWRNAPQDKIHLLWPTVDVSDIPKDKLDNYQKEYHTISISHNPSEGELVSYDEYCRRKYASTCDQLNELIVNLKNNPYSARHVVTAWIPSLIPFEQLSPQENVLVERGALAPCHMSFQCFVSPGKEEGDKLKLSLQMYQR